MNMSDFWQKSESVSGRFYRERVTVLVIPITPAPLLVSGYNRAAGDYLCANHLSATGDGDYEFTRDRDF